MSRKILLEYATIVEAWSDIPPKSTSSKEFINAVKLHRCTQCEDSKSRKSSHPVSMPENSFNHTLGVDLIEIADAVGNKYIALKYG